MPSHEHIHKFVPLGLEPLPSWSASGQCEQAGPLEIPEVTLAHLKDSRDDVTNDEVSMSEMTNTIERQQKELEDLREKVRSKEAHVRHRQADTKNSLLLTYEERSVCVGRSTWLDTHTSMAPTSEIDLLQCFCLLR